MDIKNLPKGHAKFTPVNESGTEVIASTGGCDWSPVSQHLCLLRPQLSRQLIDCIFNIYSSLCVILQIHQIMYLIKEGECFPKPTEETGKRF